MLNDFLVDTSQISEDSTFFRVALADPHIARYRDYPDTPPVVEVDRGEVSLGESYARVLAGGGGVLGEVVLQNTGEVALLDWFEVPAGWAQCDPAPDTEWQTCE